jgi:ribosomal protein S18 acetylase RimI-like enzyme
MNITLRKAELADIPLIRELSETIWKKHYISIISMEQIEYMLAKMYSEEKLKAEINMPNYSYFLAISDEQACGYLAISAEADGKLVLHKFYILQAKQHQGMGEKIFKLVFEQRDYSEIHLFVNRQNYKSVNFYFKMGFKIAEVVDNHFGDGYYMNDFSMIKKRDK